MSVAPARRSASPAPQGATPPARAALAYTMRGWPVLPCWWPRPDGTCTCGSRGCQSPAKHPLGRLVPRGLRDATTDQTAVHSWWGRYPDANVALATGSMSGLLVLDVDARAGGDDSLADLEREHGRLPETPRAQTGAGWHVYFALPACADLPSRAGVLPGLDVRGAGGYVVAPPSRHASGRTYMWELGATPRDMPLAVPPAWFLDLLHADRPRLSFDGATLLIRPGERNHRLFALGCALRRYGLGLRALRDCLAAVNRDHVQPPLDDAEVAAIAASASRYSPATGDRLGEHQKAALSPEAGTRP